MPDIPRTEGSKCTRNNAPGMRLVRGLELSNPPPLGLEVAYSLRAPKAPTRPVKPSSGELIDRASVVSRYRRIASIGLEGPDDAGGMRGQSIAVQHGIPIAG